MTRTLLSRTLLTRTALVVAVVAGPLALSGPAVAAPPAEVFGDHVRACAQAGMLDGAMNPGMHQGAAGHGAHEHDS